MGRLAKSWHILIALAAVLAGLAYGVPANAARTADCIASQSATAAAGAMDVPPGAWICEGRSSIADAETVWLRFDARKGEGAAPQYLTMRLIDLTQLRIDMLRGGREIASVTYRAKAIEQGRSGPHFVVPLPALELADRYSVDSVVVRIDGSLYPVSRKTVVLSARRDGAGWPFGWTLAITIVFGLVLAPMLANIAFFPVLRHSFMLYHAGMAAGMLMTLSVASGLLSSLAPVSPSFLLKVLEMGYVLIVCFGGFFAATFLEQGVISETIRKALAAAGLYLLVVSGGIVLEVPPFAALDRDIYLISFFPMLFVSLAAMTQAVQRGSIWVRYQIIGWTPAILAGLDMVSTGFGLQSAPKLGAAAPFMAMGIEVLVTATGVAHRLMLLRRERDNAQNEARILEKLSERDPLTGLYNRRALEERIETLHRAGYDTFALLDLDHFKQVNDTAGHGAGDDVIRIAARVIQDDSDSIAVRLGGEEFMLVMRGEDAPERAEKMRQAIALRVAREMTGLDRLVTASMGLAVVPFSAVPNSGFEHIYALVDTLLYDAKETGRNRTVSQKLRAFRKRGPDRREQAA